MGQELIYSILPRPTLQPKDLVFRRRVSSLIKSQKGRTCSEDENAEGTVGQEENPNEKKHKKIIDLKA
ncbi:MAG: hypothetical protein K6F05_05580 [Succinivibrio sp.]|nr:hypothetical protein [Succinivibrio sp.]